MYLYECLASDAFASDYISFPYWIFALNDPSTKSSRRNSITTGKFNRQPDSRLIIRNPFANSTTSIIGQLVPETP